MNQLSIIIPSYNCAQWLERAVRSTQHLGVSNPEVLIVDDGSTDDTSTLGPRLADEILGVKYFRKPNGGLSSARNYGIERATGAYILLLDADDELIPCDLAPILILGMDVIRIGVQEVSQGSMTTIHYQDDYTLQTGRTYLTTTFSLNNFYTPSWAYLYGREFLLRNRLKFMPGLLHEDNLYTVQALMAADTMIAVPILVYRYIRREGSITSTDSRNKLIKRIDAYCLIAAELTKIANKTPEFDLRWKIEEVIGGAFYLGQQCGGIGPLLTVLISQIGYMVRYRGFDAPGIRYRQRHNLKRMMKVIWLEMTNQSLRQ